MVASATPPAAPLAFGHQALAERLVQDLTASLARSDAGALEPALVVGLFGEWGAGKSRLLQAIEQGLPRGDGEHQLNVVVPFNAWRFEREEQVLIPLLRVAQQCLKKALEAGVAPDIRRHEALSDRLELLGELAETVYRHGGRELLQSALATQGVALKLPALKHNTGEKLQAASSLWQRWTERREALAKARRLDTPISTLHSLYYDFLEHLKAVTGRNPTALAQHRERLKYRGLGWWPRWRYRVRVALGWLGGAAPPPEVDLHVNLIFLVDDLDRCLPDKAVEVLEAIKLFLEVEGCAFVLALDEEVVERGIAHRYRDYALQGKDNLTPITGAEYLEKLVHLPVRVPRPSGAQAQDFLALERPAWFADAAGQPNDLARLVAAITPPVPRKLKRMVAMLEMAEQLGAGGAHTPSRRDWLALVCALQLFAPGLYRYLRARGPRLLITLAEWREQARFRDIALLREQLQVDMREVDSAALLQHRLVLARLPDLVEANLNNRSGFDLLELLARVYQLDQAASLSATQLGALIAFVDVPAEAASVPPPAAPEAQDPAAPEVTGVATATAAAPAESRVAQLENARRLLEALSAGDAELALNALSAEGLALQGKRLPEELCDHLFAGPFGDRLLRWADAGAPSLDPMARVMEQLRRHLSQRQALLLLERFGAEAWRALRRPRWAQDVRIDHGPVPVVRVAPPPPFAHEWLVTVDTDQALEWSTPRGWVCMPKTWTGSDEAMGHYELGADAEHGVYLRLELRVGRIGSDSMTLRWVAPGAAVMGSPADEAGRDAREGLQRRIELTRGYWICDTPCTVGFWNALLEGKAAVSQEWGDHSPVTGKTPIEVEKFLRRLAAWFPGCEVSLPSEAEWECAARAGTQSAWAPGQMPTALGPLSERPLYQAPDNPWGLRAMHGYVAELCRDALLTSQRAAGPWRDPKGEPGRVTQRYTVRGGSYHMPLASTRAAAFDTVSATVAREDVGFRFIVRASAA